VTTLFQDAAPAEVAGRKLVGRVLLAFLILAAALVGATTGLLLVYSTDLPQVDELEHYRPGSITELY
jgi:penicillin-binding protein 1A